MSQKRYGRCRGRGRKEHRPPPLGKPQRRFSTASTPVALLTQSLPRSPGFYLKVPGAGFELIGDAPVTGPDGRFELAVLSGYRYDVDAELVGKSGDTPRVRQSDWVPLSGSSDASLALIIRR